MAKTTTRFVCQACGSSSPKWMGRCPECGEWNSLVEETVRTAPTTLASQISRGASGPNPGVGGGNFSFMGAAIGVGPRPITEIQGITHERTTTFIGEFDRVLGGGVVPGSLVLIGGDPGIGKCLAGDSRVLDPATGDLIPIRDWRSSIGSRPVLGVDPEAFRLGHRRVAAFHDNGVLPVVRVRTRLGRTLRCTATHPVLTPEGWRSVGDLPSGSRIASPRALPYFGTEALDEHVVRLIAYNLSDGHAQSDIGVTNRLPEVVADLNTIADAFGMTLRRYPKGSRGGSADTFRFVVPVGERARARSAVAASLHRVRSEKGLSWSGWAREARVPFAKMRTWYNGDSAPNVDELQRLAQSVGVDVCDLADSACEMSRLRTPIARLLEDLGLRYVTAADKCVPNCVFRLPKAALRIFLRTLFTCDGSVWVNRASKCGVSYSTISLRLAEDVQHLLLRFGFVARLRTKPMRVAEKPYTAYELQLMGVAETRRFLAEIGIHGREEAKARLAALPTPRLTSTHFDTIATGPAFWAEVARVSGGESFKALSRRTGRVIHAGREDRPLCRATVAALSKAFPDSALLARLADGDIYWDEIVSVELDGCEAVYDLSVPDGANFVANDLVVHNSTLLTQVAGNVAGGHGTTLYVSGEESVEQIKLRAARLGADQSDLLLASETDVATIAGYVQQLQPKYLIIDSIQTMQSPDVDSAPGTVSQVRAATAALAAIAKGMKIPVFLVGHVTKEGAIAGPRVLEHMVDTVLYFEGDRHLTYRILRAVKNRFGSTDELGIFEMRSEGLVGVENPSEVFLSERPVHGTGSTVTATIEGTRPLLVEIQALVAPSYLTSPRRTTSGVSRERVALILAVLEKRVGLSLANQDVYVNVAGGVKVEEPAVDLAIALAVASSFQEMPVDPKAIFLGEIGLAGEVRGCSQIEKRLKEASRLGFGSALISQKNAETRDAKGSGMEIHGVDSLKAAVDRALLAPNPPD